MILTNRVFQFLIIIFILSGCVSQDQTLNPNTNFDDLPNNLDTDNTPNNGVDDPPIDVEDDDTPTTNCQERLDSITLSQTLQTENGFSVSYPQGWSTDKLENLDVIFSVPELITEVPNFDEIVQIIIHVEQHPDNEAAIVRLTQITGESDSPSTRIEVNDWPGIERTQISLVLQAGSSGTGEATQEIMVITTVVAADNLLIRLESNASPNAAPELIEQVLAIGCSITKSSA